MNLDVPTLLAMGSFVAACAGAVLLIAWWGNRKVAALGLWGLSLVVVAAGILALILGAGLVQTPLVVASGILFVLGQGLQWKAARAVDNKPAPFAFALLGAATLAILSVVPGLSHAIGSVGLVLCAAYLGAAAISLWPAGKIILPARRPLIGFCLVHAAVLAIGAYSTFGSMSGDMVPPLLSAFGLIHFETIIFSVASSVFLLALIKERSEAASLAAARIDSLTGVANRAALIDGAERAFERCRRDGTPIAVIMFDLDSFKRINDTFGHATGDDVLRKFCQVAAALLRPSDLFGRLGGEEFAVILARSSLEAASVRAERIRSAFEQGGRVIGDRHVNATVSGGVAASATGAATFSVLLRDSDTALYRAKADGRNRIRRADQHAPPEAPSIIRVA
ncbi:MAG: diguanylate cyclase [Pseudolabrys sp.]|nr:diguanylate cyclase [Pseudolabrys sp.]